MESFNIYIRSFTRAQKAREHLARQGVRCIVERTQRKGQGCGFAVRITGGNADRDRVCALLREVGVDCDLS